MTPLEPTSRRAEGDHVTRIKEFARDVIEWLADPSGTRRYVREMQAATDERARKLAQLLDDVSGEVAKFAEVRRWLATYPPIPDDVTGDPEAMIVVRLRRILGES